MGAEESAPMSTSANIGPSFTAAEGTSAISFVVGLVLCCFYSAIDLFVGIDEFGLFIFLSFGEVDKDCFSVSVPKIKK